MAATVIDTKLNRAVTAVVVVAVVCCGCVLCVVVVVVVVVVARPTSACTSAPTPDTTHMCPRGIARDHG